MCLPPANGRIWPSSPLYSAVYRRSRRHPSKNINHLTHLFIYLFIYLLVSPYYNTQNYNKNKNNIHDYRQGDRNSVSQLLRARIRTTNIKNYLNETITNSST